jgi:hypothetical protein
MASNVESNAGSGGAVFATKQISHDGDTVQIQSVTLMGVAGTEDSYTAANINGDATNGLDVDVTRSALPTGAATAALQTSSEALLTTIDADTAAIVTAAQAIEAAVEGTLVVDLGLNNDVTVTGSVTANAGTNLNTSALAIETGGNLAAATTALQIIDDWDESDRSKVNVIVGQAGVTGGAGAVAANTPRITLASDDPAVALLTTMDADTGGMLTALQTLDNIVSGSEAQVDIVDPIPAGTNAIGNVGIVPRTSGGMTPFRSLDIDESEEEIKATAGQLFSITAFNTTAAPLYLKFYNATAANVTVGTTTPVLTFLVPGNADSDGAGFIWNNDIGFAFGTAITVACTTAVADADTGAPGANACLINVGYA